MSVICSGLTDASGRFSVAWTPPETGAYLRADFDGDAMYDSSTKCPDPSFMIVVPEFESASMFFLLLISLTSTLVVRWRHYETHSDKR
jgi:hypothetical protein